MTTQARISEIRNRVREYNKHKNDPYVYGQEEIDSVRELKSNAVADLEFLLAIV